MRVGPTRQGYRGGSGFPEVPSRAAGMRGDPTVQRGTRRRPLVRRIRTLAVVVAMGLLIGPCALVTIQPFPLVRLLARIFPGVVWMVETDRPLVALTFDDGPDPLYTPQVLQILARHGARATFFLVGERARRHPELVERILGEGHEIGNHTDTTAMTFFLPTREFGEDLERAEATLRLGAARPRFMRPAGGWIRPAQLALVKRRGYTCVLGSAYAHDTYRPPSAYIRWVIRKNLRPGVIVVLHDAGGDRSRTVAALDGIIARARARGLRPVTLGELVAGSPRTP